MNTFAIKQSKLSRTAAPQAYDRKKAQNWLTTAQSLKLELQASPGFLLCEVAVSEELFGGKQQSILANVWLVPVNKQFFVRIIPVLAVGGLLVCQQNVQFQAATLDEAVAIGWLMALRHSWNPPVLKDMEGIQKAGCDALSILSEVSFALHSRTQGLEEQIKDLNSQAVFSEEDWADQFEVPEDASAQE